jgi:molybdopterin-synthase adenylyltransferase
MISQSESLPELTSQEREIYEWQMWIKGMGDEGQRRLKASSILVSRVGGVGGLVAYQLAAAGVGRLVLAHAGKIKPSDLNRQLLMTYEGIGTSRMDSIRRRLHDLNPRLELTCYEENVSEANADLLVKQCDLVVDCAPLFPERFAMNRACVRQGKPMVECSMFEMEAQLTTIVPGQSACLQCWTPEAPPTWKRQFPVIGAVSGSVACLAAVEVIKWVTGIGEPLVGRLLHMDLSTMSFRTFRLDRRKDCPICGPNQQNPAKEKLH